LVRAVGWHRYRLWFRDTEVSCVDDDSVTLAVPTEVHRTWLEYTYGSLLHRAAASVLGDGVKVALEVGVEQGRRREVREQLPSSNQAWEELLSRYRPQPTLDSFLCKPGEQFPLMLLRQFVHGNGQYDPPAVFLYGEGGTGKSHLLEGLAKAANALTPGDAAYLTSKRFTSRYVSALRLREVQAVRAFEADLCSRRLVLIDDVHTLTGRSATQRALVRLRERAHGTATRFVFTSRRHPQALEGFSPRLRSWLMSSVLLKLPVPDREGRRTILAGRARACGVGLDAGVADWILDRTGSVRGAVEVVDRWAAASADLGRPLEEGWLKEICPTVSATAQEEVIRRAKHVVAAHYGVPLSVLEQPTKVRSAAQPRRVAIYLVYRAAALPLKQLGRAFGYRSHSSVSRAIQQVRAAREFDPSLEHVIDGLLSRM
jgi:chromosomal replication initiator protein